MNVAVVNTIGSSFGRWTVIARVQNGTDRHSRFLCRCECGIEHIVLMTQLTSGRSQSCGCLKRDVTIARSTKHGHSPEGSPSSTYRTWAAMITRCTNPKQAQYPDYGGRGITVVTRWMVFKNFLSDMGERPDGLSLDRINNDLGYSPDNCRWATRKVQMRNKRSNHMLTHDGETLSIAEWSERTGIPYDTLKNRVKSGWSTPDCLTIFPPGRYWSRRMTHSQFLTQQPH